jgi:hypothetical protein
MNSLRKSRAPVVAPERICGLCIPNGVDTFNWMTFVKLGMNTMPLEVTSFRYISKPYFH